MTLQDTNILGKKTTLTWLRYLTDKSILQKKANEYELYFTMQKIHRNTKRT